MQPQQPSRQFNLAFRPATYWPESTGTKMFVGRIKGTARRRIAHEAITGGLQDVPDVIFDSSLYDQALSAWSNVHPSLMGGEYLPDPDPGEAEIARLELASTTADVIAVFARRVEERIRYRVVDEYEYDYVFSPEVSDEPLTLGELVALLDHACLPGQNATMEAYGLVEGLWEWSLRAWGSQPERAVEFVSVSSAAYPALADYYQRRAQEWIAMSTTNPLPPEVVVGLEEGWRRATPKQRTTIAEFLRAHGYKRGWFRKYGARDVEFVQSILQGSVATTSVLSAVEFYDEDRVSPSESASETSSTRRIPREGPASALKDELNGWMARVQAEVDASKAKRSPAAADATGPVEIVFTAKKKAR
jgi:hypothetical protein